MRDTPCAARGAEPLAFCSWRWGVAGRVDLPAEVGGGGPKGWRQGGGSYLFGMQKRAVKAVRKLESKHLAICRQDPSDVQLH
jgi:hypothetical protein